MKNLLSVLVYVFVISNCFGQHPSDIKRTYHWYFGNGAGLDFSGGAPVPINNSAMTAEEGSASISDTCGSLLFYTDGDTVWDRNNNVMLNGTDLMGCWSSTQSSLIVPQPGNDSIYYIFLTDCGENLGANGLRYSTVNINRNTGLGEVMQKNILLHAPSMEKLAGTHHANGEDIWIVCVNSYPSGPPPDTTYQYYAYLLTTTGVSSPIISKSAIVPHASQDGYMRFSHQGHKLANAWHSSYDTTEILSFDKATGTLSNTILLRQDATDESYGLAFSQDDSKLYISSYNMNGNFPDWYSKIVQYDLYSNDSAIIAASRKLIHYSDSTDPYLPFYLGMQTTSEQYILVAKWGNRVIFNPNHIDIIDSANTLGVYRENTVYLGTGTSQAGLPNFVSSYFLSTWQPTCDATGTEVPIVFKGGVKVYPNPFSDYTTIQFTSPEVLKEEKMILRIYDILGRIVRQTNILNPSASVIQNFVVQRENLPSGTYILNIEINDSHYYSQRIIIY